MGGPVGEHNLDLVLGFENVWDLGGVLKHGTDLEVEVEVQLELELVTAVFLVALVPLHLLADLAVVELEIAELHADCLARLHGGWWVQDPPSEAHDLAWDWMEVSERCYH